MQLVCSVNPNTLLLFHVFIKYLLTGNYGQGSVVEGA